MSQSDSPTSDSEVPVNPDIPSVEVKPGIQKSEGQLTIFFTVAAAILSFLGFKYSPNSVQNAWEAVQTLIQTLGPLAAAVPILKNYINSRGKVTSNALLFNAQLQNPMVVGNNSPHPLMAQGLMGGGAGLDSILSSIAGGSGKKDPRTWIGLSKIVGSIVPGGAVVNKVLDKTGIGGPDSGGGVDPKEIEDAFKTVVMEIQTLQTQSENLRVQNENLTTIVIALWNLQPQLTGQTAQVGRLEPVLAFLERNPQMLGKLSTPSSQR
jgi:hypothetical protein